MAITGKWSLNGNGNDLLGSNNGTATNITRRAGKQNQSASFNGSSSSINITDNAIFDFGLTGNIYVSFWCFSTSTTNYKPICNQRVGTSGAQFIIQQSPSAGTGDQISVFIYNGTAGISVGSGNNTHSTNVWEWRVITRENSGTDLRIYKNGVLKNSSLGNPTRNPNNTGVFYLGRDTQSNRRTGYIDEFVLSNHTPSVAEVKNQYAFYSGFM